MHDAGYDCGNLEDMPAKKKTSAKQRTEHRASRRGEKDPLVPTTWPGERTSSHGTQYEYQMIRNPYVPGEREKMLEKREKLPLQAFRIAYENHHRRKSS